ncbi:MetQ/NlpA family ABC transporter substrate-binding protein [Streptomyces noursei]|uniref:MetQ/NlpA family ABC transporter substrate-binding protein n=1 Tax=Streptomyces noursei TaxID=1971 RepID=UPI00081CBAB7|nr:MetQ/NlpA family ABC transporter substrate-binding protein [Streptomyces noursei]ANZ18056.1 ABC transporter substrate-binding protein [Streptomyces noursei ATCC 11455]MCZ1016389.1 MetQ/NlpA family ABC transporter substrate-binding protein [Streptomyces noursei]GGX00042.1 lipoprotein [Streptomyces noursei]
MRCESARTGRSKGLPAGLAKGLSLVAAAVLVPGLASCGLSIGDKDALVIAASPVPHAEIINYVKEHLADRVGLKLEVREFTDFATPNLATDEGSVDVNYFQNKPYLDDFNKERGTHVVPVVNVQLEPFGLYSKKIKSVDELTTGDTIGLPNDTVNEARALQLLESKGIIKLRNGAGTSATPNDIVKNPKNLRFKELEAAGVSRAMDDVEGVMLNGNYAFQAGLKPSKDALVLESPKNNPYTNFIAVKAGHESDPRVQKLAKLLNSDEVKRFIERKYQGSVLPAFGKP